MYRVCLLVLLGVWHASAQLTTPIPGSSVDCNVIGIQNCGKCNLPGMTCAYCAINYVLAADYKSCLPCDVNCVDCHLDSTEKKGMCVECAPGYEVKSDGTCGPCGSYCSTCTFTDTTETQTNCLECFATSVNNPYPYLLGSYSKQCQDCTQVTSGCSSCSEAADKTLSCTGCMQGFISVVSAGTRTCTACPSNCLSCSLLTGSSTPTTCSTCRTGYVANTASSPLFACLYCDSTSCSKCGTLAVTIWQSMAQCLTCQKGYYLDTNTKLCNPCPTGCATCTSSTVCQSCISSGFWLNSGTNKCIPCSYGCNTCTFSAANVESCSSCIAGFGFQSTQTSCQACPEYCSDCTDPSTCTSCEISSIYDFILVDDVGRTFCYPCPANCDTCVDDGNGWTECSTCVAGYVAGTDMDGWSYCFPCPSNCDECTRDQNTGATTCITCTGPEYYVNSNGNCVSCASMCLDCTGSDNTCVDCPFRYFLDTSGTKPRCTRCSSANCDACDFANNCTTCTPGFYIGANSICSEPCDTDCACTGVGALCTACRVTPTVAPFNNFDGNSCDFCDPRCTSAGCIAGGVCTECIDGYEPDTVNGETCVKCDVNCDTTTVGSCTVAGTTPTCILCNPGYYATAGRCSKCSASGCSTCPANVCTHCFATHTSNGAAPAVSCFANDPHCLDGSSTYDSDLRKAVCANCESPYTASLAGTCLPNPVGCEIGTLDDTDTTGNTVICDNCYEEYGINGNFLCDPCPAHCATCSLVNGIQVCSTCLSGYIENNLACSQCPIGCTSCRNVNGAMFCSQCSPQGYYLDARNGVCISCTLCTSCSANGCNAGSCVAGYGLANDLTCTDCATLTTVSGCSNCTDADSTGMAECLDCDNGLVLDGWSANCVDTSPLTDCVMAEYRPYECSAGSCSSPFEWVTEGPGRGQCGLECAVCGDLNRGLFLAECESSSGNYTKELVVGACWVGRTVDSAGNVLYARGGFNMYNCTSDNQWEFVDSSNSATTYKCCQTADGCSDEIVLDGVAGASAISFSLALLFVSISAALRLF